MIKTRDTREAAAFGTLGVPGKVQVVYEERSGKRHIEFQLDAVSVDPANAIRVAPIRRQLREGTLPAGHVLFTVLRAIHNKKALMNFIKQGGCIGKKQALDGKSWLLDPEVVGLYGIPKKPDYAVIKTHDLDVVASLSLLGADILKVEGNGRGSVFYLRGNDPMMADLGKGDYGLLLRDFRSGELSKTDPEHPFLYAMMGLKNYRSYLVAVDREIELVMIQKPGTQLTAFVREDADDKAFDTMRQFFGGSGRFQG